MKSWTLMRVIDRCKKREKAKTFKIKMFVHRPTKQLLQKWHQKKKQLSDVTYVFQLVEAANEVSVGARNVAAAADAV